METEVVQCYPNPTREKVFVDLPAFEGFMITLRNVHGQIVVVQQLDSPHHAINLSLAQGMYFYSIENGFSVLQTGKILVE
ncbi:MAG: T9SS type A sorting domain-containing protein [Bacteroidetes bacterium]|nr:T9SS type A sorting domain-containing protein [Bacteroidota bacterium]